MTTAFHRSESVLDAPLAEVASLAASEDVYRNFRAREIPDEEAVSALQQKLQERRAQDTEDDIDREFWLEVVQLIENHMVAALLSLSTRDQDLLIREYGLDDVERRRPGASSEAPARKAVARARARFSHQLETLLAAELEARRFDRHLLLTALGTVRGDKIKENEERRPAAAKPSGQSALDVWRSVLGRLLDEDEVKRVLDLKSITEVRELSTQGVLLSLYAPGKSMLYPAFQFTENGRPYAEISRVLKIFSGAAESPYTIAAWFVSPDPLLDQRTPAEWMHAGRDPELLLEAARRSAAPLLH